MQPDRSPVLSNASRRPFFAALALILFVALIALAPPTPSAHAVCTPDPALTICTIGIDRNDACPPASNTLVWCPLGDLSLIEIRVQVFDVSGVVCPGCPVDIEIRLQGQPNMPGNDIFICGATGTGFLTLSGVTDAAGEVVFSFTGGGCGCLIVDWLAFAGPLVICQGQDRFCVKSPDMNGDGTVNFFDTFQYLPQLSTGQGYCGDFNCDNTVNFLDTFVYLPHLSFAHTCPGDVVFPTTCTPPCF